MNNFQSVGVVPCISVFGGGFEGAGGCFTAVKAKSKIMMKIIIKIVNKILEKNNAKPSNRKNPKAPAIKPINKNNMAQASITPSKFA